MEVNDKKGTISSSPARLDLKFFVNDHKPIMELRSNGDIYIKGRLVTTDLEIVEGMRDLIDPKYRSNDGQKRVALTKNELAELMGFAKGAGNLKLISKELDRVFGEEAGG